MKRKDTHYKFQFQEKFENKPEYKNYNSNKNFNFNFNLTNYNEISNEILSIFQNTVDQTEDKQHPKIEKNLNSKDLYYNFRPKFQIVEFKNEELDYFKKKGIVISIKKNKNLHKNINSISQANSNTSPDQNLNSNLNNETNLAYATNSTNQYNLSNEIRISIDNGLKSNFE